MSDWREFENTVERHSSSRSVEISPTKSEIEMFEHLLDLDRVHNELGRNLGMFRDQIAATRNNFLAVVTKKYRIEQPQFMTYDPIDQKIRSIFHQNHRTRILDGSTPIVERTAGDLMFGAIQKLIAMVKARGK